MPARGHHTAPVFDPKEPRTLLRFFEDLEYLFTTLATAPTNELKKRHAVRYAPIDVADMWDQLPSYADATKTYEEWREEVKAFYPTADANRKYTLQDLDLLIGERSRLGISTAADLGDYYREFFKITEFLRSRQRLSTSKSRGRSISLSHQLFGSLYTRDSSSSTLTTILTTSGRCDIF
ncbi:hypothetical protein A0H81_12566 [Grifola frondosa]|uniref:Retrotransposon gag domain-containing protein n=1 Tax=Grifola frondosa TaxID=5627 RepID=A0A1C7LTZ3_GRIFR|nr:hypothetical protein A0H81_12566 [Grifola frondosa]